MSDCESFEFSFNKEVFSDCLVTVAVSEGAAGVKRKRGWGLFGGTAPEKAEFYATKALLARASPVFRELIEAQGQASSGKALLRLSVASSDQFRYVEAVLRHIYTKQLSLTSGALAHAPLLALAEVAAGMMLSMLSMMTVTVLTYASVQPTRDRASRGASSGGQVGPGETAELCFVSSNSFTTCSRQLSVFPCWPWPCVLLHKLFICRYAVAACVDSAAAKLASTPVRNSSNTCSLRDYPALWLGIFHDYCKKCLSVVGWLVPGYAGICCGVLPHPCVPCRGLPAMQETGLTLETASEYLCLATRLSRDHASIQPLLAAGRRRLRASFGNLDKVWKEADGRRQFAGLPLEAVQARMQLQNEMCAEHWVLLQSHQSTAGFNRDYTRHWTVCVHWHMRGTRL